MGKMTSEESIGEFAELDTTEAEFDAMMRQALASKTPDRVDAPPVRGGLLRRWAGWLSGRR